MLRWQTWTGVVLGLAIGIGILNLAGGGRRPAPPAGAILSECDGHLRELVIQYEPSGREIVATPYRDFLGALGSDITVDVVCPNRAAFDELVSFAGWVNCALRPIIINHPMTTWARDRWVALAPASPTGPTTLWSQPGEASAEIWPARAGDERIGVDIARALGAPVFARRSPYFFDGGDFLADDDTVFVTPRVLKRNIQVTVATREMFISNLASELKRRVVLLDEAPEHHAAMFMAVAGNKTVLVGDPQLARQLIASGTNASLDSVELPGGPDFSGETQHRFDAVAAQCGATGYKVVRIPTIPACDGRSFLTYENVLIDQQGARRIVYLPSYRGAAALNDNARKTWEGIGYEVRPVDCTSTYLHFGCLHCLVNVLKRS